LQSSGGDLKWCSFFAKLFQVFKKFDSYHLRILTPGHIPERLENKNWTHVIRIFTAALFLLTIDSQKMETTPKCLNW
jgi:hypothetical protein